MHVLPDILLDDVARMFALLGDRTRLRIIRELHEAGELSVGELAERAELSLANVSQHLARLAEGGLVARRRDGRSVRYRIEDARIEQLCDTVCTSVRERAARLLA